MLFRLISNMSQCEKAAGVIKASSEIPRLERDIVNVTAAAK